MIRSGGDANATPPGALAGLRVLASGSSGNCTVLVVPCEGTRRVVLIDAGLSPRKTFRLLHDCGIEPWEVDDILLTHLDHDHAHRGWCNRRGMRATLRVHRRHQGRAERDGFLTDRTEPFEDDAFDLGRQIRVSPVRMAHDSLGVFAFRFEIRCPRLEHVAEIGFATDLGRVTPNLVDHLKGVDVLAIESNYCPKMQADSDRPEFLKHRIMGGAGHLSNEECARAIAAIQPRDQLVFLHLSRECNSPARVASLHEGGHWTFTIAEQHRPTRWIWARGRRGEPSERPAPAVQPSLFESLAGPART